MTSTNSSIDLIYALKKIFKKDMNNKFFICRHCKSVMGGDEKLRELDEDGIKQSLSLSKKISEKIDDNTIIISSPFKRALQSLEPLSKIYKNIEILPDENIREINIGKSDEFTKHQIIEKMWEDKNFKVETGESQKECYDRMEIFLKDTFEIFKKEKKTLYLLLTEI